MSEDLKGWLQRIERLHAQPIDLGLDRVRQVADRLGLRLNAPAVVVGGTNGKGSTCAMLDSILRAAGYRVGLYTSPHLLRFNERARVNGVDADDDALIAQFDAVERARADTTLTYFEYTTLAILRLFSQSKLDAVILEVGLGGRLDAVNVVDGDVSIVTSVAIDHVDYLGATRELIGSEKAHIYRPGRPAICSDPEPPQSLIDHAHAIGADLWRFGRDFNYQGDRNQWAYAGRQMRRTSLPYPALRGANQLLNASGALAALEALAPKLPVSQQAVRQGLLVVQLPARFQVLPGKPAVVLDVAHNPHAAAVLAVNLDTTGFYPRTHAVFGMLNDKDIGAVASRVGDRVDHWYVGPTTGARGASAETVARKIREVMPDASLTEHATIAEAFASARERAGADDRILAFGSFVSVAEVMRAITETSATVRSFASHTARPQ
ncbi:MAG TPA: bifunctional tetrahydrofolate synthase/dihydrofolate synthase [Burkholderiaceae bacterium]|nr:bifunctional tetrahydrofolate synthase/dihydrofolate synthase [Burkholderiaceae bacterium]